MLYRCALKLAVPILAAALCAAPARAADHNVTLGSDLTFNPQTVTINAGDTVIWTNDNAGLHDVRADDGSFASIQSNNFTFSHTFDSAGTVGYHCQFHGGPGVFMFGTVIVQGSGGGTEQRGTLRFSLASYSVNEGAGSATINVQRVGGDDGAVSVTFSATAGTATAGQDFTAATGTLSWANNDDGQKSFTVPIANDSAPESNETVSLALSDPTGGATLDNALKTATLTIQDNDSAPGGTPAAPSNLQAAAQSTSEIGLTWTDNSNNEVGFSIERRTVVGTFQEIATVGAGVATFTASGLDPSTFYLFRVRASGGAVSSPFSNEAGAATFGNVAACVPGPTALCINDSRFRVEVDWRIPDGTAGAGQAVPIPSAADSGLFYFFGPDNLEMLLKVLNACEFNNRFWVFYAATTNVEFAVVVTDTQTGRTKGYFNPLNRSAPPVQDVDAFATCP